MPRIRTIKPEFPQSESMGRVSREARLLFILLWTLADDSGRLRGNSRMLASLLFPYDDDAGELIATWIHHLEVEDCIRRYTIDGDTYLEICNWLKHQKIDKPSASKLPQFSESSRIIANPREVSVLDQGSRTKDQGEDLRLSSTSSQAGSDEPAESDAAQLERKKTETKIIERSFAFYCESLRRDQKRYTLTDARRKKALWRLRERTAVHGGDIEAAEVDLAKAIKNLAASEYHITNGYIDWIDQIFRSPEEFEKRLNWSAPIGGGNGQRETANARIAREAIERLDRQRLYEPGIQVQTGTDESTAWFLERARKRKSEGKALDEIDRNLLRNVGELDPPAARQ